MSGASFFPKALRAIRRRVVNFVLPIPINDYAEHSAIFPIQSGPSAASEYLLDLALQAADEARFLKLPELSDRLHRSQVDFTQIWPGDQYRLLAALVKLLQPRQILEIGTLHGLSALALMKFLPSEGRLTTFDIVSWDALPETCLSPKDFLGGRLSQELGDLADLSVFNRHRELIGRADLLFVDGPKDGVFEKKLLQNLETVSFASPLLIVFDDIRLWNMLQIWHSIARPKLDMTSFGHWSGTGLVEWKPR